MCAEHVRLVETGGELGNHRFKAEALVSGTCNEQLALIHKIKVDGGIAEAIAEFEEFYKNGLGG